MCRFQLGRADLRMDAWTTSPSSSSPPPSLPAVNINDRRIKNSVDLNPESDPSNSSNHPSLLRTRERLGHWTLGRLDYWERIGIVGKSGRGRVGGTEGGAVDLVGDLVGDNGGEEGERKRGQRPIYLHPTSRVLLSSVLLSSSCSSRPALVVLPQSFCSYRSVLLVLLWSFRSRSILPIQTFCSIRGDQPASVVSNRNVNGTSLIFDIPPGPERKMRFSDRRWLAGMILNARSVDALDFGLCIGMDADADADKNW
ncbi:hypothetical protein BDN70DRAFT_902284 [Pholiota conissans]|uniref:Uncharacterized protein n=1 Tax=Pholiota conissans TaxID=109636 RepID=A0A9P5YLW3_9AGAR|nr:hypothetical protein BDN70DRAFT_902284 [Pholiota conissans]